MSAYESYPTDNVIRVSQKHIIKHKKNLQLKYFNYAKINISYCIFSIPRQVDQSESWMKLNKTIKSTLYFLTNETQND